MFVFFGIVFGVLILLVSFLVAVEIVLNNRMNTIRARQGELKKELYLAKKEYREDMQKNNKEIAKELYKLEQASKCFVGLSQKVPVSELLYKFMGHLGYDVIGRDFKIIKKGDQLSGKGKEKERPVGKVDKK